MHGHIHYGSVLAKTIEDYKAVSMNVMHSSMKITDEFYSNLNDSEVQNRINLLGHQRHTSNEDQDQLSLLKEFLQWKQQRDELRIK